jgi:hypothetical protein
MGSLNVSPIYSSRFCKFRICSLTLCELRAPHPLGCLAGPFSMKGKDGVVVARMGGSEQFVTVGRDEVRRNRAFYLDKACHLLRYGFSGYRTTAVCVSDVVPSLYADLGESSGG